MSSMKCFDLSPQVHTVQALSGSNICVVRACTRVIYSRAWWRGLLVNLHAPTPFAQIGQGYLRTAVGN